MSRAATGELELLDQLRDGVVIADEAMAILYANPTLHRIAGYPPGSLTGRPVETLIPPGEQAAHQAGVDRVRAGGSAARLQAGATRTQLRRSDATLTDIELTLRSVSGPSPAAYMALIRPVSDALLQADAVLASVGEGVYGLDCDGRVTLVNPAAARMTGFDEAQQVGRLLHDLVHHHRPDGSAYPPAECPILATLADGQPREVHDEVFWTGSGRPLQVDYTTGPVRRGGQVVGSVVTFRDAEQRRHGERARLLEATAAAQRLVISELHRAILPDQPALDGYQMDVTYLPAGPHAPTGGDLYDWAQLPEQTMHLCVVDVAGHDVAATKHAVAVVHTIRALVLSGTPLPELLDRAGQLLEAHYPELTATAAVVHLHLPTGRYQLVSAGHPPPLQIPAGGPAWFHSPHGTPLGAPRPPAGPPREGKLEPGDALFVYTDGLVESRGDLEAGMERLRSHFDDGTGLAAAGLAQALTAGAEHRDDVLHLLIRRL